MEGHNRILIPPGNGQRRVQGQPVVWTVHCFERAMSGTLRLEGGMKVHGMIRVVNCNVLG
jgi:hypothetical protein